MKNKLNGVVELMFIRSGISKSDKPYLILSNGRKEFFVNVQNLDVIKSLANYNEEDLVKLEVSVTVGSDSVNVLKIVP